MTKSMWEFLEWEGLIEDSTNLRTLRLRSEKVARIRGKEIDDLVCDILDEMASEGTIVHRESIDTAYYIAEEIKKLLLV